MGKRFSRSARGKMTNSFFNVEHATVVDTAMTNQIAQQFAAKYSDIDIFCEQMKLIVRKDMPLFKVLEKIATDSSRIVMPENTYAIIIDEDRPLLITVTNNDRHNEETIDVHSLTVHIYGDSENVLAKKYAIEMAFAKEKMARVKWWFDGRHGNDSRDIYMPELDTKLHPEFYPDLGASPEDFMKKYLASPASVLLMAGPAGTGKTTLLRHLVLDHKLSAHVIFEEEIMKKDAVFQSFLFDDDSEIMIIEDADTILSDRERDGNKMMARFLSISDGLIKLPNKKLVFTTNLNDFGRVDDALIRPGRCFATVKTRELDLAEAIAAAKVAGLPIPEARRTYTLAELFNPNGGGTKRKVGF